MKFLAFMLLLIVAPSLPAAPPPPGSIIYHSPAGTGLYIGSPALCVLPNGDYLASHDLFGPKSNEHVRATGRLYRSTDKGATWSHVTDVDGYFWTNLFVHNGAAYALGTDKHHGQLIIRRSTDHGTTWSEPAVIDAGQWHTAPMPVIEHDGRLWRAFEDAHTSDKWGERYRARMISAPVDADLLKAESWTLSNAVARNPEWLDGRFNAWLEGSAVVTPEGKLVDVLRVDLADQPEKAALVAISADGRTATFDPGSGFVDFDGGAKKFTIRKDPDGPGYWSLANVIPEQVAVTGKPGGIRNTLALVYSADLRTWETRCVLLYHPDTVRHGFQYPEFHFDGDDLIATVRTAWDDDKGGAHNNHDANFLTFHRWKNFRALTREDDVPMPEFIPVTHETDTLTIKGSAFEVGVLHNGETAFSNRGYTWQDVPPALAGKSVTRLAGGERPFLDVTAKTTTTLTIATADKPEAKHLKDWTRQPLTFHYTDQSRTPMNVYTCELAAGQTLRLPGANWTGTLLLFDEKKQ